MLDKYKKLYWTEHAKVKMRQYGLSKMKLMSLLRKPERQERGIAEGTMALMRPATRGEIWLMYRQEQYVTRIISAWRYPGISKPGDQIPIPKEIREELLYGSS